MKPLYDFWRALTRGTRFQILFYSAAAAFGILFFLGPKVFRSESSWQPIMLGLGIAFVASSVLGFAQRLFFYDDFRHEMESLVESSLKGYLAVHMFPFINEGLECLYDDRRAALRDFSTHLKLETDRIVIIGSSLKGMLDPTEEQEEKKQLADLLRSKIEEGVTVRFLLTHPALAFLREDAEGRANGAIKREIIRTLRYLLGGRYVGEGEPSIGVPIGHIRLYHGTPTIFSVIVSDRMLVNPYTYQANAYENFSFDVSRRGHKNLYAKILSAHYEKPWDNHATRTVLSDEVMENIDDLTLEDLFPSRLPYLVRPIDAGDSTGNRT